MQTFDLKWALSLLILPALFFTSCEKQTFEPVDVNQLIDEQAEVISEQALGDYNLLVYATDKLIVGHNKIYYRLQDADGNPVENYELSMMPMMDMGMMQHSTPYSMPMAMDKEPGVQMAEVTFIMPSTGGTWALDLTINVNGEELSTTVNPEVIEPTYKRLLNLVDERDGMTRVFVALIDPMDPEVGENDLVLGVYYRESMMSFPKLAGLSIAAEPWMPSMSHGSPNNVDPSETTDGTYQGVVNFSMTGDWEIRLDITDENGETVVQDAVFEFLFQ